MRPAPVPTTADTSSRAPAPDATLLHRVCVAPMLDWTTRHCRYFMRLLSRHTVLYTEMITTGALLHGDSVRHLQFHPAEHPLAVQLGGSDPAALAACAALAARAGYDEVNLNVGCPSDRVQAGRFGACLMAEPALVASCVQAMRTRCDVAVTVKTRLGIDTQDSYEFLLGFVEHVRAAGCRTVIVHARKAWLQGLSPKQNREIPPLMYERVHRLKREFPELEIVLNGGVTHLDGVAEQLRHVDGVMIGREACQNPYLLAGVDRRFHAGTQPAPAREDVLHSYCDYVEDELRHGTRPGDLLRPLLGLFQGEPGARAWRRHLSEHGSRPGAGARTIEAALARQRQSAAAVTRSR
ncbi:MAG: tRNA dihydrouridine(20/20a) synthase DusA [Gammaproteobacteria bacterium]|nr:tRNA dihydrouridine(20/20a) synthase DusA [Gammaproteobacteria bacterium]